MKRMNMSLLFCILFGLVACNAADDPPGSGVGGGEDAGGDEEEDAGDDGDEEEDAGDDGDEEEDAGDDGDPDEHPDGGADGGEHGKGDCPDGLLSLTLTSMPAEGGTTAAKPLGVEGGYCYESGTVVELEAFPADGWVLEAWKGTVKEELELSGGNEITMDGDEEAIAKFIEEGYEEPECEDAIRLTIHVQHEDEGGVVYGEAGAVELSPAGEETTDPKVTCQEVGIVVGMHLTANPGFTFDQWSGKSRDLVEGEFPDFTITLPTKSTGEESEVTLRAMFVESK